MFSKISPEKAGIPSKSIANFINTLNSYNINTHSIIMAKGNNIIAESYYEPFGKDILHRMYSVSKSFVAIAIGLAEQEGLLSLDDKFIDYFPEYQNENIDKKYQETTIRDMLTMRSCMAKYSPWWESDDRARGEGSGEKIFVVRDAPTKAFASRSATHVCHGDANQWCRFGSSKGTAWT